MKPLIVANWKMNPSSKKEAEELFKKIKVGIKQVKNAEVVICPQFICAPFLKGLALGAQNYFSEEKGAYTGEVSAFMIKSAGLDYAIIGHSERRKYFSETDEQINKKIKIGVKAGLKIILCIGETAEERDAGNKTLVLKSQLENDLKGISKDDVKNISIAYEPIWAIGTGNSCSVQETTTSLLFIKQTINNLYNREIADKTKILYGGSVNAENSALYIKEAGANGLLVGGASLKADDFVNIVKSSI